MSKFKSIVLHQTSKYLFENDLDAFLLMTQIMFRARRPDSLFDKNDLEVGQALIGDYKQFGWSEKKYRLVKKRIQEKYQLASFHGNNQGTIATLLNADFCEIQGWYQETFLHHSEEAKGEQKATGTNGSSETYDFNGASEGQAKGEQKTKQGQAKDDLSSTKSRPFDYVGASEGQAKGEQRATNIGGGDNNIYISTTTNNNNDKDTIIPLFQDEALSNSSSGDIILFNPKGIKISISESEVYRHFLKSNYSTAILKQAISETRNTKTPVSDILRYIEAICERLKKKQDLIPSDNKPKIEPPKCTEKGVYGGKYFNF